MPQHLEIEGYHVEGISIAVSQDFLFVSHAHMDHIGVLSMYIATRGHKRMCLPTYSSPLASQTLCGGFDVHHAMDQSDLDHKPVSLDVGEEYRLPKEVRAFRTYHVVPWQGM